MKLRTALIGAILGAGLLSIQLVQEPGLGTEQIAAMGIVSAIMGQFFAFFARLIQADVRKMTTKTAVKGPDTSGSEAEKTYERKSRKLLAIGIVILTACILAAATLIEIGLEKRPAGTEDALNQISKRKLERDIKNSYKYFPSPKPIKD